MTTDAQLSEDRLEIERILPARPETVWQYLTDPALRQKWFCAGTTDAHEGGKIVLAFDHRRISKQPPPDRYAGTDTATFEGTVTTYDPPHVLAFEWPEENGKNTHVTITLTARGETTHLHLVHKRLHGADFKSGVAAGWHAHLDLLVDIVSGRGARDFWAHFNVLEAVYEERMRR